MKVDDLDLDEQFPPGDGTADDSAEVTVRFVGCAAHVMVSALDA